MEAATEAVVRAEEQTWRSAERTHAATPHALGDDIDVPWYCALPCAIQRTHTAEGEGGPEGMSWRELSVRRHIQLQECWIVWASNVWWRLWCGTHDTPAACGAARARWRRPARTATASLRSGWGLLRRRAQMREKQIRPCQSGAVGCFGRGIGLQSGISPREEKE